MVSNDGILAAAMIGGVCTVEGIAKCQVSRYPAMPWAMKLSMMVAMTSFTPKRTLSTPAKRAQDAPAIIAEMMQRGMAAYGGREAGRMDPVIAAAKAPIWSCPSAPILKSLTWNGMATARATRTSVVILNTTCPVPYGEPNVA